MMIDSADETDRYYKTGVRGYLALIGDQRPMVKKTGHSDASAETEMVSDIRKAIAKESRENDALWELKDHSYSSQREQDCSRDVFSEDLVDPEESEPHKPYHAPILQQLIQDTSINRGPKIYDWNTIKHVELVHRQGLNAPSLTCTRINSGRTYFKIMHVQTDDVKHTNACLFVRRKSKRHKYRFSFDESKLCRRGNPSYAGKCMLTRSDADTSLYTLSLPSRQRVATILSTNRFGKHHIRVDLLNQYLNWHESGPAGLVMNGFINNHVNPMLSLRIEQSQRTVLVISKPDDGIHPPQERSEQNVHFDYPLTMFLVAAIFVIVNDQQQGLSLYPTL
uniref:Tubby C-terminal domain-containing protein n=1 Tax=Spongospora subterranea TaxID=70186 RepID=A0A0H5QTV6_9EUKA|eukprot:CRZ05001.1 hypothetical protein [Spongospora subterranea]